MKRGLVPALISAYIVPETGPLVAKQLMLTGQRITAKEALQLGLLTAVADSDKELDVIVQRYIDHLLSSASGAMQMVKEAVNHITLNNTHDNNLTFVQELFTRMVASEEAVYGMSQFVSKQTPDWNAHYQQQQKQQQQQARL